MHIMLTFPHNLAMVDNCCFPVLMENVILLIK